MSETESFETRSDARQAWGHTVARVIQIIAAMAIFGGLCGAIQPAQCELGCSVRRLRRVSDLRFLAPTMSAPRDQVSGPPCRGAWCAGTL